MLSSLILLAALLTGTLQAGELTLTEKGVTCGLGAQGTLTLGIPALDGRNVHAAVVPSSIQTDGSTLTAKYAAPFEDASLRMRVLPDHQVEYVYEGLPEDVRLAMSQFNLPREAVKQGVAVTFDDNPPIKIPVEAGKTNDQVRLASLNAKRLEIAWADNSSLVLISPYTCWHGIQDARVWGKDFVGVCLTPPLKRDAGRSDQSTFTLSFELHQRP